MDTSAGFHSLSGAAGLKPVATNHLVPDEPGVDRWGQRRAVYAPPDGS